MSGKEEDIMLKLTSNEREVLNKIKGKSLLSSLVSSTGLKQVEVMRAIQWLGNKGLVETNKVEKERYVLGENGEKALKEGLPEKRLLERLKGKKITIRSIQANPEQFDIERGELNFAIGALRRKNAIKMDSEGVSITNKGEDLLKKGFEEQKIISDIKEGKDIDKNMLKDLIRRKDFVELVKEKDREVWLTPFGKKVKGKLSKIKTLERLTPEIIKKESWRGKKFRHYDIKAVVPKINAGRKHFINETINYVRKIWIELGFKEMSGRIVQNAFWDMDALFVPQDHPAREMQDTFYVKGKREVPSKLFKEISRVHENGGKTESKGWGSPLDKNKSEMLLLRTHSTVLSAITLSQLSEEDIPGKYFTVSKVFRNETLDWSHLFEFYQVEGIVVADEVNFSYLKGFLSQFYEKMGYDKIRIKPAYFPYTEPSAEVLVYSKEKKSWIELGGAGIFRPEVTVPLLGREIPVLAWGLGLGRIMMPYYGFKDLRDLYRNDIKVLRRIKKFMRV